ncbi:hypothetical protein Rs2_37196 [Raphanus sativus]|nr:hypothetical protein Rs2_37196 [Raphanus sativus]
MPFSFNTNSCNILPFSTILIDFLSPRSSNSKLPRDLSPSTRTVATSDAKLHHRLWVIESAVVVLAGIFSMRPSMSMLKNSFMIFMFCVSLCNLFLLVLFIQLQEIFKLFV